MGRVGENKITEKTLVIIKPDAYKNRNEILRMIREKKLSFIQMRIIERLSEELLKEHYHHCISEDFFPELLEFMQSGPVLAVVVSGKNAVNKVRELVGATDPAEAKEGTIRALYGTDKTRNAIHASDSLKSAKAELKRFFPQYVPSE